LRNIYLVANIQGDSGEKGNIFGSDSIGYREKKRLYMNTCLIVNSNQ